MKTKPQGILLFILALLGSASHAEAQSYHLRPAFIGLSFEQPIYLTSAADRTQRLFVVEKRGTIQVFDPTAVELTMRLFLDIRDVVRDFRPETGLLGLAFHPDYKNNGRFFVHYSGESFRSFIAEFRVSADPDSAVRLSERVILQVRQPSDMHNGGQLEFGPDGYLYIGFGDGGSPDDRFANGQDRTTLLATILRLDIDGGEPYSIPPDNPFVDDEHGWREEIWAWGLRNPWRFSFDPHTEELWVGDVGEGEREEVNIVEGGHNYGWPRMEGSLCRDEAGCDDMQLTLPVFEYDHSEGAAINGGYVYRGRRLAALHGAYLFGDFGSRKVWSLRRQQDGAVQVDLLALAPAQITSFGRDALGEIYVLTIDGEVLQLTPSPPTQPPAARLSETGIFVDLATQEPAAGVLPYEVNVPLWSDGARKRRYLSLPTQGKIGYREEAAWSLPPGTRLIKNFYLPDTDRIVETRILIRREEEGWEGSSYRWNEEGTEALLLDGALHQTYTVDAPTGITQHTHYFPAREECGQCHTRAAGFVLGVRTGQLNRGGQIQAWMDAGLFIGGTPHDGALAHLPSPNDVGAPVSRRARAYLDVNCAHCHQPTHFTRAGLDLRYDTDLEHTGLLAPPTLGDLGVISAQLLTPGAPQLSILYRRILDTGSQRMPPLATAVVDTQAVTILAGWIEQLLRTTSVDTEDMASPGSFHLDLPFPSPANGQITISFHLSVAGPVRLELFDVVGQRVDVLLAEDRPAGAYRIRWETEGHASGMYFLRLVSGGEKRSRRLVVLK